MAVCHSIVIDKNTGKFNASSPDELALIKGAQQCGVLYTDKDSDNVMTINFKDEII